jgi:hypothetical protein
MQLCLSRKAVCVSRPTAGRVQPTPARFIVVRSSGHPSLKDVEEVSRGCVAMLAFVVLRLLQCTMSAQDDALSFMGPYACRLGVPLLLEAAQRLGTQRGSSVCKAA